MPTPLEILNRVFGHDQFRGMQSSIIDRTLAGHHSLVIMPTGMGKSLCFQIPALIHAADRSAFPRPPLTLVLSPLIALMKDQVDALQDRGIAASFVNSSLNRAEREARYRQIGEGELDLLYVTPERFRKPDFLEVLDRRSISLLAVDEAHCISEWGHDFRPDYTRVGEIRERVGGPPTIALTATATPDVQQDILRQLDLTEEETRIFHAGIERPNLRLDVERVWDDDGKLEAIDQMRKREPGSGIVYFTLIKSLLQFSDQLRELGWQHVVYHGDLARGERRRLQEQFMNRPNQLVLATNAFGMGIDKEDIRFVLHADLPGSLESYYQEIGRAGRDGEPSQCLLLYDERDLATQMEFLHWSNPDAGFYRRVYDFLEHDREQINAFGLEWLREKLHHRQKFDHRLESALAMLFRWNALEGTPEPLRIDVVHPLPERLSDESALDEKRLRDQKKLLAMVQYAKFEGDRKQFLSDYFGIPRESEPESRDADLSRPAS